MELQIPTDLIQRLQFSLRAQAGLPAYDPDDPTLPALPSLRQSVAAVDSSPPDLRCRNCRGRLLRGPQSAVCVYCGGYQPKEPPPEPVGFRSTLGCRWLLQSLDLDGSEIVETSTDKQDLNRGQSTPKDKISLSDLLNLEIRWPTEQEILENSLSENASTQKKSLTNLAGVDLDKLFTYAEGLVSDLEAEQAVKIKQSESMKVNAFAGKESSRFPLNIQKTSTVVGPVVAKDNDDSGWEADFQAADSGRQSGPSNSLDQFVSSTADLSTHMDSMFGPGLDLEDDMPKDVSTPPVSASSDWAQRDLGNSSNFIPSDVAQPVKTATEVIDRRNADYTTSTSTDWFPDDQLQTHSAIPTENKPSVGNEDSIDVWDNFTSSSDPQDPTKSSSNAIEIKPSSGDYDSSDVWDDFASSSIAQDPSKSSFNSVKINATTEDVDPSDVWDDFTSSLNAQNPSNSSFPSVGIKETPGDDESSDVWHDVTSSSIAEDPFNSSFPSVGIESTTRDGDSSDAWDGFTSFSSAQDPSKETTGENDSSSVWDGFKSSSNAYDPFKSSVTATDNKPTTGVDSSSDVWDDFTSSSNAQDPSKSSFPSVGIKAIPGDDDSSDVWDDFTSSSHAQDPSKSSSFAATEIMATTGEDNSSDVWDDFTSSSHAQDPSKSSSFAATEIKAATGEDNSLDVWDVFTSSSTAYDPFKSSVTSTVNKTTTGFDYSSDVWDGFTSSSNTPDPFKSSITPPANKPSTGLDDSSNFWNGFSSSLNIQNLSKSTSTPNIVETATIGEQKSDAMFTSSTSNFHEMSFANFSQSDVLFGSVGDENDDVEVKDMQSEVFTSKRMVGDIVGAGDAETASEGVGGVNPTNKPEDDLENLFSQMHDLSFMLKTELSVPSKKNDPSPQDLRPSS